MFRVWPFRRRARRDPRATFEFWDGSRDRSVDPIEVWGRLNAGRDVEADLRTVLTPPPPGLVGDAAGRFAEARQKAAEQLAARVCDAFGVEPYSEGAGLTIPERIALAARYVRRMRDLGDAARPT